MSANTISSDEPLYSNTFFGHPPISCKINAFKFHLIQSHILFCRVSSYSTCKPSISHHSSHSTIVFNMNNLLVFKSKSYQFSKHFMSNFSRCFQTIYIIWTFKTNSHQERKFHIIHALKLTSFRNTCIYIYHIANHFGSRPKGQINIIKRLKHNHIRNFKTPILKTWIFKAHEIFEITPLTSICEYDRCFLKPTLRRFQIFNLFWKPMVES